MGSIATQVSRIVPAGLLLGLTGCVAAGAPSFILFGAYFPAWMLCALLGLVGAIAARATMVAAGLSDIIPYQLFVCASAGVIVATCAWLVWFEQ